MLRAITQTTNEFSLTILRVALGVLFFAHGAQKLLGWFGGGGYRGTMHIMNGVMGIPAPFVILVIVAEFFGGLGLILGLLSRIAAFGIAVDMTVAVLMVHRHFGLFMNWTGRQKGEGFEYHILAIVIALAIMIKGAGALSLDRLLAGQSSGGARKHAVA